MKFKNYFDDVERQLEISKQNFKDAQEERIQFDEELMRLEEELKDVEYETKNITEQLSPMRKQKEFINDISEEFVYSRERQLQKYRNKKK